MGYSIHSELSDLKGLLEEVRACHLLLQERFRAREEEIKSFGEKALSRHRVMAEGVSQALLEYMALVEGLSPDRPPSLSRIEHLLTLLQTILPVRKKPIFGTLPYKHLRYPAKEPPEGPLIRPAYGGGDRVVKPEDLQSTSEAPITQEIALLAQSLNWNPVSIYEWVKNNIETEWYWGMMKGAEETLRQRRGNDADQASLLISLLRASGYPARYVRGVIEFFPDLEGAKNLFGIDEPHKMAEYLQKAGIPFKVIISGGRITNLQMEHIWVEVYVPYANYRGAILDEHGKTWLGLDTSIKVTGYSYNSPREIPATLSFLALRDQYLSAPQNQTPLEYLRSQIGSQLSNLSQPVSYEELLWTRTLIPEVLNILPASLQFRQTRITHEYTELPEELRHRVRFIAAQGPHQELFDITLDASRLSNQKIVLTYEPESREDQEIINSYGGLDNTPGYLIRLRPVLTLNGEKVAVGREGLPMGREYELILELISPNGVERIINTHITGNLSVIGIVSQNASLIRNEVETEKNAETLLHEEAIRYIERWNRAEEELASLFRLRLARPIPTVVTLGGVIEVSYLLDTPYGFEWKGLYVDSDLRAVETVTTRFSPNQSQGLFMELSSLQGSILENRLFEEAFGV
ncbi:MAG: transglutaminase family protein, partial [Desulfobacterota bacterium]|nr:transglutaminase family protein [Thermodesulfobacteriota bacterium]